MASDQPPTEFMPHDLRFAGQTTVIPKKMLLDHIDQLLFELETESRVDILPPGMVNASARPPKTELQSGQTPLETLTEFGGVRVLKRSDGTPDVGSKRNMYVGFLGHAMMYFHLFCKAHPDATLFGGHPDPEVERHKAASEEGMQARRSSEGYLRRAMQILDIVQVEFEQKMDPMQEGVGFFCGLSGYYALKIAVACAASRELYDKDHIDIAPPSAKKHPMDLLPRFADVDRFECLEVIIRSSLKKLIDLGFKIHNVKAGELMFSELLYGRAGYLWSLAFAYKFCPEAFDAELDAASKKMDISDRLRSVVGTKRTIIDIIVSEIVDDGLKTAKDSGLAATAADGEGAAAYSMIWEVFGKYYLGAAHGSVGICYALLLWFDRLTSDTTKKKIVQVIDELCALAAPPHQKIDIGANVHDWAHYWCHGYPGLIPLLAKAYVMFKKPQYLAVAQHCTEVVWREGLLRKGCGLCHGVYGNAYTFLTMFRLTREHRYLYYAVSFYHLSRTPEFLTAVATYHDPERGEQGVPDSPFSLMEGTAGQACFLIDLIYPDRSNFPGYETTTAPPVSDVLHKNLYPLALPQQSGLQNQVSRVFFPGIWAVNWMDPTACASFLERVYASTTEEHKKTDAIRLGQEFSFEVNALCGLVQHFVETEMVPADATRIEPPKTTTHCGDGEDSYTVSSKGAGGGGGNGNQPAGEKLPDFAELRSKIVTGASLRDILQEKAAELQTESKARLRESFAAAPEHTLPFVDPSSSQQAADQTLNPVQPSSLVPTNTAPLNSVPRLHLWRAYVIRYDAESHPSIQSHTDACDITFNLCLRRTTTKGHLIFNESNLGYQHEVGQGVLFWGNKVHHTHSVGEEGERAQIVLLFNFMHDENAESKGKLAANPSFFPMLELPQEVQGVILSYLPVRDLAKVSYSCKALHDVASDDDAWMERYRNATKLTEFYSVDMAANGPQQCFLCSETGANVDNSLTKCETCSRYYHLFHQETHVDDFYKDRLRNGQILNMDHFSFVHCCPECKDKKNPNSGEDTTVPRLSFGRRNLSTDQQTLIRLRAASYHSRTIDATASGWKAAYNQALCAAGSAEEMVRSSQEELRQEFWRAIIGCYPVHNIHGRGGLGIVDRIEDIFEPCDECGPSAQLRRAAKLFSGELDDSTSLYGDDDDCDDSDY